MVSMIDRMIPLIATWGVWIAGGLLAAALLGIWRLGRGGRRFVPAGDSLRKSWPRRIAAGVLALIALVLCGVLFLLFGPMAPSLAEARRLADGVGQPAPDFVFHEVCTGAPRELSELRGQVVLVNVWATWCPPCRKELPDLDKLQKDYAGRGLVVLTVSTEERDLLQKFAAEHPLRTLNAYSPGLGWYDAPGRPITFVIDREGTLREYMTGEHPYEDFAAAVGPWLG